MSLKQIAVEYLQLAPPADGEARRPALQLIAAAETPLGVMAAVVIGGVTAGMPAIDIFVCGLVAGGGVALCCAVTAWLFDAPMGPGLTGLWDDFGHLRRLRFRRSRHPDRPDGVDPPTEPSPTSSPPPVAVGGRNEGRRAEDLAGV